MTKVTVGNRTVTTIKQTSPNAASQDEVNNGVVTNKYVSPKTLNNWPGGAVELENGNGTTANGSAVDLGGTISANTIFSIDNKSLTFQYVSFFRIDSSSGDTFFFGQGIASMAAGSQSFSFNNGDATLNLGSDATGDIYYRNASGKLTRIPAGTEGQVLTMRSGIPTWE